MNRTERRAEDLDKALLIAAAAADTAPSRTVTAADLDAAARLLLNAVSAAEVIFSRWTTTMVDAYAVATAAKAQALNRGANRDMDRLLLHAVHRHAGRLLFDLHAADLD